MAEMAVLADESAPRAVDCAVGCRSGSRLACCPPPWAFLPALPLTANGKVDRKALAKLRAGAGHTGRGRRRNGAADSDRGAGGGIFAEVLRLERRGGGRLFALGGHSLLATQVASRVLSVLGVELPLRTGLRDADGGGPPAGSTCVRPRPPAAPLVRVSRREPLVLSFAQLRLWFWTRWSRGARSTTFRWWSS